MSARLAAALSESELKLVRDWCAKRHDSKPWYGECDDSPKALVQCDFMVALIDEVLSLRSLQDHTPSEVSDG